MLENDMNSITRALSPSPVRGQCFKSSLRTIVPSTESVMFRLLAHRMPPITWKVLLAVTTRVSPLFNFARVLLKAAPLRRAAARESTPGIAPPSDMRS